MSIDQKLIVAFIALSLTLTALHPDTIASGLSLALSSALFGLSLWLKKEKETRYARLEDQIRDLKARFEALTISKGMGR